MYSIKYFRLTFDAQNKPNFRSKFDTIVEIKDPKIYISYKIKY